VFGALLNEYVADDRRCFAHEGTVAKVMGDAINSLQRPRRPPDYATPPSLRA